MIGHGRRAVAIVSTVVSAAGAQSSHPPAYLNPAWAPDGRSLAFESDRDGKFAVYTIRTDGTALTKLTSGPFDDVQPRWSPDGKRIAFVSNRDGHDQIYTMAPDGSGQIRLTTSERDPYFLPTYSPDGAMILFAGQSATRRDIYYVCVMRSDGTRMRLLTDSLVSSESPRWSHDGRNILFLQPTVVKPDSGESPRVFMRRRNASMRQMTMRPDGSGLAVSAAAAGEESSASVSPDGHLTAREKTVDGVQGIYLLDAASGAERRLVPSRQP
jgi:Tol biopolymer transport system component